MSTTTDILQEINAVDGVAGSFVCDAEGHLLAREPLHLFDDKALTGATHALAETMAPLATIDGAGEVDLLFGDGRLIVRPLDGALLGVLCVPRLNLALLKLRTSMALQALRRVLPAELTATAARSTLADRVRTTIEEVLGERSGKVLALVPAGDPDTTTLKPVIHELERFTRLFIGRDEAAELGQRLRATLDHH